MKGMKSNARNVDIANSSAVAFVMRIAELSYAK